METSKMRNLALIVTVAMAPSVASAKDHGFTVPAIVRSAQATTPTPQGATPPIGLLSPHAPTTPAPGAPTTPDPGATTLVVTGNGDGMTPLSDQSPPPLNLLSPNIPLTKREAQAAKISREWRGRRSSPGEGRAGAVMFTYGASIPSVVCAPLYVCNISLQPGEVINDIKAGDSVRWLITPSIVGAGATAQTIISVKPTDAGLRTNLVVATTRRLYNIALVSSAYKHTDDIAFTYPEDAQVKWSQYRQIAQQRHTDSTLTNGTKLASLDFNYRLSGSNPAWRPLRVYSDGIKTYIQFPRSMLSGDAPTLVSLANDGGWFSSPTKQIVNYRVEGDVYVVDRVLAHAALLSGVGGSQDEVKITHEGRLK